jgi:adenylosuccinate lyase
MAIPRLNRRINTDWKPAPQLIIFRRQTMNSCPITYSMYSEKFASGEMLAVFDERHYIQLMLNVEAALARAEGALGLIPVEAAEEIASRASVELIDLKLVQYHLTRTGHYIVALTRGLQAVCGNAYGQYVHFGATTQDIIDTAQVLRTKEACSIIERDLLSIRRNLEELAKKYKDTPMAGRTHVDHAVPLTFGFKVAVWLDEVDRHLARWEEMKPRLFVGNITGAVGTFASLGGEKGFEVQKRALEIVGLIAPPICWHAARDRFAEFTGLLAMIASTLAKIANEVRTLMRPEIAEIEEPIQEGKVGSSTMPHKRNPNACEDTIAMAKIIRNLHGSMLDAMGTEHERDGGCWRVEYITLPEICLLSSAVLRNTVRLTSNLVVHPDRMLKNLDISRGMIVSEAAMFKLSQKMGKQKAHEVVYECSMNAHSKGISLLEALSENNLVKENFDPQELREVLNPTAYTGMSGIIVEKVVSQNY